MHVASAIAGVVSLRGLQPVNPPMFNLDGPDPLLISCSYLALSIGKTDNSRGESLADVQLIVPKRLHWFLFSGQDGSMIIDMDIYTL